MKDLRGYSLEELKTILADLGLASFRAKQLFEWIHKKNIFTLEEAHNLGKDTITKLRKADYDLPQLVCLHELISKDGQTEKYLLELADGETIECVLMHYDGDFAKKRYSLCVSSQVGCAMGCQFCATGKQGLTRQLTLGEILAQVYWANRKLSKCDNRVGNIVFMGMGEPFHNYDNLIKSIYRLNDVLGAGISQRRMTVSTCGIVPKIRAFADLNLEVGLAISLHEVENHSRSALMPINQTYPLEDLIKACHYYQQKTKKRLSFEYALASKVNVSKEKAMALARYLKGLDCHINLIPINAVDERFQKPTKKEIYQFLNLLEANGLKVSIRQEKGGDIEGACGQLKSAYKG